jgi:NAD(P)H-binding
MEEAQIKRLICVTGFGAGDSRGYGGFLYSAAFRLLVGRLYDDKDVQERIVRSSELDWVIVRPVILTNGPKNQYLSRASQSARLDLRVHLTRRRSGFPRQADRRRRLSA